MHKFYFHTDIVFSENKKYELVVSNSMRSNFIHVSSLFCFAQNVRYCDFSVWFLFSFQLSVCRFVVPFLWKDIMIFTHILFIRTFNLTILVLGKDSFYFNAKWKNFCFRWKYFSNDVYFFSTACIQIENYYLKWLRKCLFGAGSWCMWFMRHIGISKST